MKNLQYNRYASPKPNRSRTNQVKELLIDHGRTGIICSQPMSACQPICRVYSYLFYIDLICVVTREWIYAIQLRINDRDPWHRQNTSPIPGTCLMIQSPIHHTNIKSPTKTAPVEFPWTRCRADVHHVADLTGSEYKPTAITF